MAGVIAVISPERRIKQNPYDVEAWTLILRDVQRKKIDLVRPFYESLVKQFPNAGRFWRVYVEQEVAAGHHRRAEQLMQRCLVKVLNIDLWKTYVKYVRSSKGHSPSFREKMAQVYDFALDKVGLDFHSTPIYTDYIIFLKSVPAAGSYAENQKISAIRKVYHRALATPLMHLEQIWVDYCAFEKGVNQYLADKLISEKSRDYQQSRRVSRLMETVTRGLNRNMVSVPPRNTPPEIRQHRLWKAFIKWETANPTQTEDHALLTKRVIFAYEQALLCMGFHSDLWYEASLYMQDASRRLLEKGDSKFSNYLTKYTTALMNRAINFVGGTNVLLHFAYADYEEEKMHFSKAHAIYNNIVDKKDVDPTLVYVQSMRFLRRREGIMGARLAFRNARLDQRCSWHVYVAAAQMEYACGKDAQVPRKIYELALKRFPFAAKVALAYADFLISLNDVNGVRDLFERVLTRAPFNLDDLIEIWNKYVDYESCVADFQRVRMLRRRRYDAVQRRWGIGKTAGLIDQYRFETLLPCSLEQLPLAGFMTINMPSSKSLSKIRQRMPTWSDDCCGSVPRPRTEDMAPFKPRICLSNRSAAVGLPSSAAVSHLLSLLPPLKYFLGPLVDVDKLLDAYSQLDLTNATLVDWQSDDDKAAFLAKAEQRLKQIRYGAAVSSLPTQFYRPLEKRPAIVMDDDSGDEVDDDFAGQQHYSSFGSFPSRRPRLY